MKSWSSSQASVATTSGEFDFNAHVRGAAEAFGLKSVLDKPRWEMPIDIMIDSAAKKSVGCGLGLGERRYMEVKLLWVQEAVRRRRFRIIKILGTTNLTDVVTEPKSIDDIRPRLAGVGFSILGEVTRRKICPERLCAHVPGGPTSGSGRRRER